MPVFRSGKGNAPAWCEMEGFDLISLAGGESRDLPRAGAKEQFIVCRGLVRANLGGEALELPEGAKVELDSPAAPALSLAALSEAALVFRAVGRWQSITSSGIFTVQSGTPPAHDTPYLYEKSTGFDNHYHDCDEYWVFFEGACRAASEGRLYDVGPGDCVATGMGWHHDVLCVEGGRPARAVWFEGTLEGAGRVGHLWEPRHGKAEPPAGRG